MGMGDKPQKYEPSYDPVRCDASGKMFSPGCVRSCPEPHVVKKYGIGGKANVSVYICQKCKFVVRYPMMGGVGCGYTSQET